LAFFFFFFFVQLPGIPYKKWITFEVPCVQNKLGKLPPN